jgi:hypothetical protein
MREPLKDREVNALLSQIRARAEGDTVTLADLREWRDTIIEWRDQVVAWKGQATTKLQQLEARVAALEAKVP